MTPEQIAAIKTKSVSVGEKHRTFAHVNDLVEWQVAEITRLTAALEESEKGPLTPKVIAELIRGKAARMGRLEEMQENTRFYSEGDWSVTPGNIPRPTKPCVVLRLTEDEAAAIRAMVRP